MNNFDVRQLSARWQQYIIKNKIADPSISDSGERNYKRTPNTHDVYDFLTSLGYSESLVLDTIDNIAHPNVKSNQQTVDPDQSDPHSDDMDKDDDSNSDEVISQKKPNYKIPATSNPVQQVKPNIKAPATSNPVQQVKPQKPHIKMRATESYFFESFLYESDYGIKKLTDKEIIQIFNSLISKIAKDNAPPVEQNAGPMDADTRNAYINKIRKIIRDTMTDSQRASLWRELTHG
jgi:hypothetical protein